MTNGCNVTNDEASTASNTCKLVDTEIPTESAIELIVGAREPNLCQSKSTNSGLSIIHNTNVCPQANVSECLGSVSPVPAFVTSVPEEEYVDEFEYFKI